MTDNQDTAAYLEELAATLASHGSNLAALRREQLEQKVSPYLAAPASRDRQVGLDRVADTLGNTAAYIAQKNLILDPTMEGMLASAAITGAESIIGWGGKALLPAWYATIVSGCASPADGLGNVHLFTDRDSVTSNQSNSAYAIATTGSVTTGTHEILVRTAGSRAYTSMPLPYLVAAVRVQAPGGVVNPGNLTSAICTIELFDVTDGVVRASTSNLLHTGNWEPIACSILLAGQPWNLHYFSVRLRFVAVCTGPVTVYNYFAEPQLNQTYSPDAPSFHPLLGSWAAHSYPSVAQTLVAGTALLANAKIVQFTCSGGVTTTAAPTIANGVDGQMLTVLNVGSGTWTIVDQGTLASSNLRLTAANVALAPRQSVQLVYSATVGDWVQVGALTTVI